MVQRPQTVLCSPTRAVNRLAVSRPMLASIGLSAASAKEQSLEKEMPFVYGTLATHLTLATAWYSPCSFEYVTIGLAR